MHLIESKSQSATLPSALSKPTLAKLAQLSPWVRAKINMRPAKGEGHRELFRDACAMTRGGFTDAEIEEVLRARYENYYRPLQDREFSEAIRNAGLSRSGPATPQWPKRSAELVARAIKNGATLETLIARSPVKDPHLVATGDVIDRLFPSAALICMGASKFEATTESRGFFKGRESRYPYVVPNPMTARFGKNKTGGTSSRCLDNCGPWLNQVFEFDDGSLDDQAARLIDIWERGVPLRMVVHSGGRSLHSWFDVRDLSAEDLSKLRCYASALGADPATFTACQLVRNPNATRENGSPQKVFFLV
jgi:hypothetical protein